MMSRTRKYTMGFDGQLLRRGFWLYVWRIQSPRGLYLYVGRTGDSSSPYAASPFTRVGRHLDVRPHAKSNAMTRQIRRAGLDPTLCWFQMVALGPLYPEQKSMKSHRPIRDKVAALEGGIARFLQRRRYSVLGSHGRSAGLDARLFARLRALVAREFPPQTK